MTTPFNHFPSHKGLPGGYPHPTRKDTTSVKCVAALKLKYLLNHFVPQFNRYACSAASVTMVINTICRCNKVEEDFYPLTQQTLLKKVDAVHWRERLSPTGHRGRHGVSLADLEIICKKALDLYKIPYEIIDMLHLNATTPDLNQKKELVHRHLSEMSASGRDYILAYFTQGELVGEWFGSHVSPIATYDSKEQAVLVLDVDPEVNGPYQVPLDRFLISLVGSRNSYHRRGGGWVRIRI